MRYFLFIILTTVLNLNVNSRVFADVSYYFTGAMASDFGDILASTAFSGSFSYNYPQDQNPLSGSITIPGFSGSTSNYSLKTFLLNIGNQTIYLDYSNSVAGNSYVCVHNGVYPEINPTDYFEIKVPSSGGVLINGVLYNTTNGILIGGIDNIELVLRLTDYTHSAFSTSELPADNMSLNMFTTGMWIGSSPPSTAYMSLNGTQSSLATLVPEPSALSLLAVGLGGLAMMRRRRS